MCPSTSSILTRQIIKFYGYYVYLQKNIHFRVTITKIVVTRDFKKLRFFLISFKVSI